MFVYPPQISSIGSEVEILGGLEGSGPPLKSRLAISGRVRGGPVCRRDHIIFIDECILVESQN